jgi:serine/threonine protein kinase
MYSQSFLCPALLSAGGDGRSIDDDSVGGMAPRSVSRSVGDDTTPTPETAEWPTYEGTTPLTSPAGEVAPDDEVRDLTEMDLATFLEFAIQATQCVESLHARGATHLDIRPSAFHFNVQTGSVRFAHMGHRSVPLDELNSEKWRVESMLVREAVAYVAPEQTGLSSFGVDQRTDLYGLGATFLALLTGQIPWSHCTEVLHSIVSRKPRRVTELRPDVPPVLAAIIDRLLAKNPDDRYRTASGLGWDLIQAQLKLTDGRGHDASSNAELLPSFLLGTRDRFSTFIIPSAVYGREKELETIRGVLSRVVNTHALQYQPRRPALATPTSSSVDGLSSIAPGLPQSFGQQTQVDLVSDGGSSSRASRAGSVSLSAEGVGPLLEDSLATSSTRSLRTSSFASSSCPPGRGAYARKGGRERSMAARTVVISGPAGSGKSALIVECQRDFRKAGFFGVAKFESV